jgi:hypothetical protein
MPVRVQVRKDKSNGSSFPDVAGMPSPAIHFTRLLFFLLYNRRRIMNKQKAVNELKKLRYEVQSARVKDSVEFELEILEEEYEVIKALSDDGDLTPIDFGHLNDINYMRTL